MFTSMGLKNLPGFYSFIIRESFMKNLNSNNSILLPDTYCCKAEGTISKYQNTMPNVARKAFIIGEVWNSVW